MHRSARSLVAVLAVAAVPALAWAGIPSTCTTAAAVKYEFGSKSEAWNRVSSPSATYGGSGCDDCFLVEYGSTSGKSFDPAARYADSAAASQSKCEATKVTATAWGLKGGSWEIIGPEKTARGTWSGSSCQPPVVSLGRVTGSSYSKVRIAARANRMGDNGKSVLAKVSTEAKDRSYPD